MATQRKRDTCPLEDPEMWAAFSAADKRLWRSVYRETRDAFAFPPSWDKRTKKQQALRDVVAHNVAIMAVWRKQAAERRKVTR